METEVLNTESIDGNSEIMPGNILVIEDDADLAELLRLHLVDMHCTVNVCNDGLQGLELLSRPASERDYELVILDLNLPGLDGLELCKQFRQYDEATPILMLTSRDTETDRVLGLEVGADDYLTKPFGIRELQARVKAILRRQKVMSSFGGTALSDSLITVRDLTIDTQKRLVRIKDRFIETTAKEFELLLYLINRPGQVFSRQQLLDAIWGYGNCCYEHTVNSNINRLRAKIEANSSNPDYILTVWGVGYKFREE